MATKTVAIQLTAKGTSQVVKQLASVSAAIKTISASAQGLTKANQQLLASAQKTTTTLQQQFQKALTPASKFGTVIQGAATQASGSIGALVTALGGPAGLVVAIGTVGLAVTGLSKLFDAFLGIVKRVSEAILDAAKALILFGYEAATTAGAFNELVLVALAVGDAAGHSRTYIDQYIRTLKEVGVRTDVAAKATARFVRNNIDLADAVDILRIAQGISIYKHIDVEDAIERVSRAVITGRSLILGYLDVTTKLMTVAERERLGLTQQEQIQENVNRLIRENADLMALWDAAMQTPTARLRFLTETLLPEMYGAFGQYFQPAFLAAINALSDFVIGLTAAFEEGGKLYPLMVTLGAWAWIFADAFKAASDFVIRNLEGITTVIDLFVGNVIVGMTGFRTAMNRGLGGTLEDLAKWTTTGLGYVVQFAAGLINFASTVLNVGTLISNAITWAFTDGMEAATRALTSLGALLINFTTTAVDWSVSLLQTIGEFSLNFDAMIIDTITNLFNVLTGLFAAGFEALTNTAVSFAGEIASLLSDVFNGIVDTAVEWGRAISSAIAEGLAAGAELIVDVILAIADIFTDWFAPGSPPKVAPEIDKWGLQTIEEWLQGMLRVDFDILEGLQGILKQFLDPSVFKTTTARLIEGLADFRISAKVDESLLEMLRNLGGDVGPALERLARTQFDFAAATEAAAQAERDLAGAQDRFLAAGQEIDNLTRSYNEMLRAGADKSALRTQLAEINAAEQRERLALNEQREAEARKEAADEQVTLLKERMGLQEDVVKQLLGLMTEEEKAAKERAERAKKAGGEAEDIAGALERGIGGVGKGIGESLRKAMEGMKQRLLDTLGGIFEPLRTAWEEDFLPAVEGLQESWTTFTTAISDAWNTALGWINLGIGALMRYLGLGTIEIQKMQEAWESLKNFITDELIPNAIDPIVEKIADWIEKVGELLGITEDLWAKRGYWSDIANFILFGWSPPTPTEQTAPPPGEVPGPGRKVQPKLAQVDVDKSIFEKLTDTITTLVMEPLEGIFETLGAVWQDTLMPATSGLLTTWETFTANLWTTWQTLWSQLQLAFQVMITWLTVNIVTAINTLQQRWQEHRDYIVQTLIPEAFDATIAKLTEIHEWMGTVASFVKDTLNPALDGLREMLAEKLAGRDGAINAAISGINRLVSGALSDLEAKTDRTKKHLSQIYKYLVAIGWLDPKNIRIPNIQSGTRFFPGGMAIVGEVGPELVTLPRGSQVYPHHSMQTQAVINAPPVVGGRTSSVLVNFENVTISNGMDWAVFKSAVLDVVGDAVRTG